MKKTKGIIIAISVCLIVALLLSSLVFFAIKTSVKNSDIVATVNGLEICAEEFKLQMSAQKGYVIDEIGENKTIDDKFWKTEIDGVTPLEVLKQRALDYFVKYKVEQQIAVDCGVIKRSETSFSALNTAMQNENKIREQKVNAGEVIYGVKEYTYNSYLTYTYSNMQIDVREKLGEKGNKLYTSDAELKKWYDSVKEVRYPKFDTMKLDYYKITWSDVISPEEAESIMKEVRELVIETGTHDYCDPEYKEITIDDDNAPDLQKTSPQFFEAVSEMRIGDVTEVINENNSSFFAVLKSVEKAGYKDFDEYKTSIYTECVAEKYETYVEECVKSAKIGKTDKFKYLKLD
ncbi:MAG: peptidyl-prolyl cis-trans isomerase [Clostridia bacterium]|nr:peptidyl-prolyl cis-trans isomerase [Clostridia bacterium]